MFELTPYRQRNIDLFRVFDDFEKSLFAEHGVCHSFRTDIRDLGDAYRLEAELPGFRKEDIRIDVTEHQLSITAKRDCRSESKEEEQGFVHCERVWGSFQRNFNIDGINADKITADYDGGVLTITLPKKSGKPFSPRQLEIN